MALNTAFESTGRFAVPLPQSRFLQPRDCSFPARRSLFASLKLNRRLVTAFRSPATAASFKASIPGSKFPACSFACLPAASAARSALRLRYRPRVPTRHGRFLASSPLLLPLPAPRMARPASTPLRDFYLPKDQSVPLAGHPAARLPIPPDLRSLPAAFKLVN